MVKQLFFKNIDLFTVCLSKTGELVNAETVSTTEKATELRENVFECCERESILAEERKA